MKKLLLISLISLSFGWPAYSQSQRLVLAEEFTQASCAPCASANPALNALLQANTAKVTSIKYQVSWPGYDPMYFHNPGEVDTRVSLYGVTGVPNLHMDGNVFANHPNSFNQTIINNEYAVPSPFTITITHNLSADFDSIFINVVITASQAITSGNFKGFAVLVEKHIAFTTPPGTNGETDFYNVMKKMYPDANGYTLPSTWNNGQSVTMNFAAPVPWAVYKINELAVVAFVQDMSTKTVQQAAYNAPIIQPGDPNLDAGISSLGGLPFLNCLSSFNFNATLNNAGTTTITSASINYQIDSDTIRTIQWTGSLAQGASAQVSIPVVNATAGQHSIKVWVTGPNGLGDLYPFNNTKSGKFNILTIAGTAIPFQEGFQSTFPPTNWVIFDGNDNGSTWKKGNAGGYGQSSSSAEIPFFDIGTTGEIDELYLPPLDFSSVINPYLWFDLAYARYSATYTDRLKVLYSVDCGVTWTEVFNKAGAALATTTSLYTSSYTPTASQWRTETIDLNGAASQSKVFIKFQGISGYGNNCYIDNILIQQSGVSINENETGNSFEIMPNPFSNSAEMLINITKPADVKLFVYNSIGSICYSEDLGNLNTGSHKTNINGSNLPSGLYFVVVNFDGKSIIKKVTINK